ncbi:pre-mRNA-splicing factor cwc22 [Sorochytrium milnesiophthora]
MQAKIQDKSSEAFQRMSWEALKKSINGLINKANTSNIKNIIPELISENLVRGSGLFCRSIMKSQSAALPFTPVYTALIAVLNTKFPQLGELICTRLILQFRKAYRRNDKLACLASTKFLAHLVNFRVAHEMIAFDILIILLEKPTDDSVEVAVGMMKECGAYLTEVQPRAVNAVFEIFRRVLHEGALDLRTQYMIEVLFQVRKDKFKDNPAVPEELDLVDEDDMVTHKLKLDDTDLDPQDTLNIFHYDPEFLENEEKYSRIKHEILGSSDDEDSGSDASSDGDDDDGKGEVDGANQATGQAADAVRKLDIMDKTDQDVIALRRKIYLTIMSSLDFQECVHKLMRLEMAPGQEIELCNMIIECCSQERTYMRFYGMMAERFAKLNRLWMELFSETFKATYATIHRYETNRLRNVSKLFAHMLATDGLPWQVMECVRLTEESTTSSSRIFLKILFQEMNEQMGIDKLSSRLKDPYMRAWFDGLFPKDSPKNTRFAINYWTSIGLGAVTAS